MLCSPGGRSLRVRGLGLTARMMLGMLPSFATTCSRETASTLPTMSRMSVGRNFSTCAHTPAAAALRRVTELSQLRKTDVTTALNLKLACQDVDGTLYGPLGSAHVRNSQSGRIAHAR